MDKRDFMVDSMHSVLLATRTDIVRRVLEILSGDTTFCATLPRRPFFERRVKTGGAWYIRTSGRN